MPGNPVRIVHLSDLHFGAKDCRDAWRSLTDHICEVVRPELVLVTGDLVDTPKQQSFADVARALDELDARLGRQDGEPKRHVVCAGNHDRHKRGVAKPWRRPKYRFERSFTPPRLDDPHDLPLGDDTNEWKVRVVSIDTSVAARYSAQAFLDRTTLEGLRAFRSYDKQRLQKKRVRADDIPLLLIMLLHHHLLPLPGVEKATQSWTDLFQLSSAVNPGTILENLTTSQVDLVLHGHEHCRNMARYASYRRDGGQVAIVAAGSATGMKTLEGCDLGRASFNLLELRPDRSVWCKEVRCSANGWAEVPDSDIELIDPTTLRHNRFRRMTQVWPDGPATYTGEWEKHVIFTEERDAIVRDTRRNWLINGREFSFRIQNDTGQPASPEAQLDLQDAGVAWHRPELSPIRGDAGAFAFRVALDNPNPNVVANCIETSYQWLGAVLLDESDFDLVDAERSGEHRCERREFIAASVLAPIRSLSLTITLPVAYYPADSDVHVYREEVGGRALVADEALTERLQFTGQTIVLSIPYPLLDYRYSIAWHPVATLELSAAAGRLRIAATGTLGETLAASCVSGFAGSPWDGFVKCAVYLPLPDTVTRNRYLIRAKEVHGPNVPCEDRNAPEVIDMREQALLRKAWWGQLPLAVAEATDTQAQRHREGLTAQEIAAATLPLTVEGDFTPWAIVRLGVSTGAPAVDAANEDAFRRALARGRFQALYEAASL